MRRWLLTILIFSGLGIGCGASAPCDTVRDQCACYARSDCQVVTESCWCPSVCDAKISCVCGGGQFLRCEAKATK